MFTDKEQMKVHFIAIGGQVMHNLALSLKEKGTSVSGSDDAIYEPSASQLKKHDLFPDTLGWHPERITTELDAVIVGMHAKKDNPELAKAKELGLKIYSFPEYIFQNSQNKQRVVIAGSHGKTSITAMLMHVLKFHGREFDYVLGAYVKGFDTTVRLSDDANLIFVAELVTQTKLKTAGQQQGDSLTRNVQLTFSGAASVTAINVPAVFWQLESTSNQSLGSSQSGSLLPVLKPDGISSAAGGIGWGGGGEGSSYLVFPTTSGNSNLLYRTVFNDIIWTVKASDIHASATHWVTFNLDGVDDLLYVVAAELTTPTLWLATITKDNNPVINVLGSTTLPNSTFGSGDTWVGGANNSNISCPSMIRASQGVGNFTIKLRSREIILDSANGALIEDTHDAGGGRTVRGGAGSYPLDTESSVSLENSVVDGTVYGLARIDSGWPATLYYRHGDAVLTSESSYKHSLFMQMNGHYVLFSGGGRPLNLFYYTQKTMNDWAAKILANLPIKNRIN